MESTNDTLDACMARLSRIKAQMDCEHDYHEEPGLVTCKRCLASITTCLTCDMPTYDEYCPWCDTATANINKQEKTK